MNQDDKNYITDTQLGKNIKYLESRTWDDMSNITIDGQEMDLSQTMPSYAQVVVSIGDTSISVSSNEGGQVLTGSLYTQMQIDRGLIIQLTTKKLEWTDRDNLTASDLIGKSVPHRIVERMLKLARLLRNSKQDVRVINDRRWHGGQQQFHADK